MANAADVNQPPLFSFGVITDVQYADIPDGRSFLGVPRYYRHSMDVLRRAVKNWNNHGKLKFAVHYGDIVDGFCPKTASLETIKDVATSFDMFQSGPVYHIIGNHCLYNLPREKLIPILKIPSFNGSGSAYYEFSPCPEYRVVVLDGYDVSVIGWPNDHPNTLKALEILARKNPNSNKDSPSGLEGVERRFVKFNGAVGEEQLVWLNSVLENSTRLGQKVLVFCHLPLDPSATVPVALLWNYDEVMDVIHRFTCVKACISGHAHEGGHSVDLHGIHHRVLEAALECPPGTDAYGHIDVYDDKLCLRGTDRMASTDMLYNS